MSLLDASAVKIHRCLMIFVTKMLFDHFAGSGILPLFATHFLK